MKGDKLPAKQKRFCEEFMVDFNATAAYLRAGYKSGPEAARRSASELLTKPDIAAEIARLQERVSLKTEITREWIEAELAKIAGFDPRKLFEDDGSVKLVRDWDDATAAAVQSFDVAEIFGGSGDQKMAIGLSKKVSTRDKVRALELLGKARGMFPSKIELGLDESLAKRLDRAEERVALDKS